ncbi:MAG TPA: ATP-binding protein [Parapedobacter sp.]|uniref:ATP-binding protein n=1 Tax=Parapedobacter sp. TaxID=1958893 RepID=UPI002C2E43D6|nr:ATP-binding protein [Parapedobacter sp.]HWK58493.1 ATP-binding protein [Parapedobacter sp.]
MKEKIKHILIESRAEILGRTLINRAIDLHIDLEKAQAILGPRRTGKTSAMVLAMKSLIENNAVSPDRIIYFNFEDERIQLDGDNLDLILQAWQELFPELLLSNCYFFFDEVQAAGGWEYFINRISETITKKIFFTGSNSAVLHTEIKSVMRGRSIPIEVLQLSFPEYCKFANITPTLYGRDKAKTLVAFYQYLENGGYPETINLPSDALRTTLLQEYYSAMLLRDIVEYNKVSNFTYLRSLYRMAASSIGKTVSMRRLHNQLKANDYTVGLNSVYEAMDMAEHAYLFKRISRFDFSDAKRDKSEKKIYWLDNGLLNANTAHFIGNKGILLENLLFRELYRRFGNIYETHIYYFNDATAECDFIVFPTQTQPLPIQVCWTVQPTDTRTREIKGLLKACTYCKVKEGWILTAEDEETLTVEGITIRIIPTWKWFLQVH